MTVKLTQVVHKPTRITSTSATLIDLMITNKPEIILLFPAQTEKVTSASNFPVP